MSTGARQIDQFPVHSVAAFQHFVNYYQKASFIMQMFCFFAAGGKSILISLQASWELINCLYNSTEQILPIKMIYIGPVHFILLYWEGFYTTKHILDHEVRNRLSYINAWVSVSSRHLWPGRGLGLLKGFLLLSCGQWLHFPEAMTILN